MNGAVVSCDFCLENLYWTERAGDCHSGGAVSESSSRLIQRDPVCDAIAGLGAIVPGYVLIVPRQHVESVGELTTVDRTHVFATAWRLASRIRQVFSVTVVLVEHGSSGGEASTSRACLTHAHIHLFPVAEGSGLERFVLPGSRAITDLSELALAASRRQNYYFCAWEPGHGFLYLDPPIKSQHARRVWAELIGVPEEWDWAMAPYTARALTSAELLGGGHAMRLREVSAKDALTETIATYDQSAQWYAARTCGFPRSSTLRDEVDYLVANTSGIVLDAGCGTGRDSQYIASTFGRRVIALDASAPMLSQINDTPSISRVRADVRDVPLADASIGAVWCSAVLVHLDEMAAGRALDEFRRVLVLGGLVHISVKEGHGHAREPMVNRPELARHFYYYSKENARLMVERAGFAPVKTNVAAEINSAGHAQRWVKIVAAKAG